MMKIENLAAKLLRDRLIDDMEYVVLCASVDEFKPGEELQAATNRLRSPYKARKGPGYHDVSDLYEPEGADILTDKITSTICNHAQIKEK